ncbi:MAG: O-antigen ligase family protein [Clostridia bacterium]|nr:O-antigen ligase family protein [Clostridia bacterium]
MDNGIILSALLRFWNFLKNAYENSGYYKIFNKIADFIGRLYRRSLLFGFFKKVKTDATESGVSKLINSFFGFFHKLFHEKVVAIGKESGKSVVVKNISSFLGSWYAISVRYYALTLTAFVCFRLVLKRVLSQMIGPYTLILALIAALGIFIDVSPAALYEGSKIRKLAGFGDLPEHIRLKKRVKPHKAVTIALCCGSISGLLTLVPVGWLAIGAVCGVILLIAKPFIGVMFVVACFPVLPTMGVVALGVYLLATLFIKYLYGENKGIKVDTFDIAILAMCALIVYGVLNSFALSESVLPAAVYMLFVSSFYAIRRAAREKGFLNTLLNLIVLVSVAVSLYGIYQKLTGQAANTWTDTEMFEDMGGRIYSTFGNPNVFGEYLLIVIPITFGLMLKAEATNRKNLYLAAFSLQMVCMILTYSRGCWIGIMLAMGLMLIFTRRKISSLFIFAVFLLPFVMPETIVQRIMSIGDVSDSSTSYRVYIWQGTLRMLKDFWYSGVGIGEGAFGSVYPHYALNGIIAPHSHNLYLHILSETGICGLATVITLVVLFYKYISSTALKNPESKIIAVALGCSMIGYLAQGMFDNVWYNYRIYFFFFVVLALGASLADLSSGEGKNVKD